ncbi:MAG: tRNA epoxyqueuosine(34) reductase QueG [Acidimicrobiaceae bacterium]|nr:tRNA epoxyqueuosine(34) reductase QueG [Acidimicrobiaceae bacterium]
MRRAVPLPTWDELVALAAEHDIHHVGVAPAEVLVRARTALVERKAAGLHAGMQFTYRNPDRSTDPSRAVEGARSILVFAKPYLAEHEPERPPGAQGRVGRYAWVDHYGPLRTSLQEIARRIRRSGHRATAFTDDNSIVDREVAYRGGLGWFGKNANLLLPGAGSFFVLGSIITTAEYEPNEPVPDGCGTCRRCLDGCPTGAIVAPGVVDANRCLAWLVQQPGTFPLEYREALGDRFYGCDDCQEVCPPTVRLGKRHEVDAVELAQHPRGQHPPDGSVQAWVDVLDVLEMSDDDLVDHFGRWYLAGRDPIWWRRNALVVLGNVGDAADERTRRVLDHYRSHDSELLRELAEWAAGRLGLQPSEP